MFTVTATDLLEVVREWKRRIPDGTKLAILNSTPDQIRVRLTQVMLPALTKAELRIFHDPDEAEKWVTA